MDYANRFIATYIMASGRNGTLYVGVTSNLPARVSRHKLGVHGGFTDAYDCKTLVWYEPFEFIQTAIRREKQLKKWLRAWKLALIEQANPDWRDLSEDWLAPTDVIFGLREAETRRPSSESS